MAQVAASKVAQKAGEVMASKKLFGHADEAQKKIKKKKKTKNAMTKHSNMITEL